ncbi:MAG: AAA family ATPase [Bacteroidales bacterium]|nr:AAA family ATPase [Bacteroidales bacterium]
MKKAEKSAKTTNSETNLNANPQISKETKNDATNEATNEVNATDVKVQSKNAQISPIVEEFEKLKQKVVEEFLPIDEDEVFPILSGEEMLTNGIQEIPMLVPPLIHSVGLALFIGSSDIGKSSLLRQLGICVVSGRDFCGMKINAKYNRAIICSGEDDEMSISFLLKKQNLDLHLKPEQLKNLVYIFDNYKLIERLEKELQSQRADVVIIDPFTDSFSNDLYKAIDVRVYLNQFSRLAKKYECLIIFMHHTRKGAENLAPSKNNALGSQSIEAKARLVLELKASVNNSTIRHLCPVKGNYIPQELKRSSIDLMFSDNLTFKSLGTNTPFDKINTNEVSLSTLEAEYKEIISLKEQGLNYREIGIKFGVSHSTIISRMKRYEKIKNSEIIVKD